MIESKWFWRIIILENGNEITSAQGTEVSADETMKKLIVFLQHFYLHGFPKQNGHTIEIKTIFEKVTAME